MIAAVLRAGGVGDARVTQALRGGGQRRLHILGRASITQAPIWSTGLSASGPMTATFGVAERGRQRPVVLEQHEALRSGTLRRASMRLGVRDWRGSAGLGGIEQAEAELQSQNIPDRAVDAAMGTWPRSISALQVVEVGSADHLHIDAGADGFRGGLRGIGGEAVRNHLDDRFVVADHQPSNFHSSRRMRSQQ